MGKYEEGIMLNHRVHTCFKVMVGCAAMLATVQANEVGGINPSDYEGPTVEVVSATFGAYDSLTCTAVEFGYLFLEPQDLVDDGTPEPGITLETMATEEEVHGFRVYMLDSELPELVAEVIFDAEQLALNGSAEGSFSMNDQIVAFTTNNGSYTAVIENTFDPDVGIDCYLLRTDMSTGSERRLEVINNSNKRKVKKAAARKKAATKRKKAVKKRKAT
jgi:hypothetical protein